MDRVPKKLVPNFTSWPFAGCLCALFELWCVSRQMELTPAVIFSHWVLWWRGTIAPGAGDISLYQGLSSHCLSSWDEVTLPDFEVAAVSPRMRRTFRQLCMAVGDSPSGIWLLTSWKNPVVVFFLKALEYWLSCVHNMDAIKNAVVKNPSSTNLSSEKKRVRVYFHARNWRHNNLF